jgi:hypothetical protein
MTTANVFMRVGSVLLLVFPSSSIQRGQGPLEVQVSSEFRPLPSIPNVVRNNNAQSSDIQSVHSNRHSITTMSTVNRDGISEVFGSIDTVVLVPSEC